MTEWIDLTAPSFAEQRKLGHALCESRISRPQKFAVARIAQSERMLRVKGAIPAVLETLCWLFTFTAGVASGLLLAVIFGWRVGQ